MVNWIMGEAHLEFRVKNLQFGADLVHRTLIHLHLVDELGDLFGGKGSLADVDVLQTHLQFGGVNSILPVKYHGRTVYRLAFRKTERMLCIEEGQCPAIAPRTGRSRVPKRLCRPAVSMVRYERRHDDRGGACLETGRTGGERYPHARQGRVLRAYARMPDECA